MILLNDFIRQWRETASDVLAATQEVGESGWYVLGERVARFEQTLAAFFGRKQAVGCASGLDAIEIGLRILGVRPGDRVLTTPLTAFATTLAIVRAGARPVFVDVDDNGQIDLGQCEARLLRDPALRAFVPVHLYGYPLDLGVLARLKARFGLALVEDAAQAIGAAWEGRAVGSVGEVAATSFYPTKNLGCIGDGGALLMDDPALAARAASLRNYGQSARYHHDELGLNSRLDELQAALLERAFFPRLAAWTERRRTIAARYLGGITHPQVRLLRPAPQAAPCWHLFPVFVPAQRRAQFQDHLQEAGVQTAIHYPRLVPDQKALADLGGVEVEGKLPVARRLAAEEVSLPIHPYLQNDEIDKVIAAVNRWPG